MKTIQKWAFTLIVFLMLVYTVFPLSSASASRAYDFSIYNNNSDYLIGGDEYVFYFDSEKAKSTYQSISIDYSINNGETWREVSVVKGNTDHFHYFRVPMQPEVTSALFKLTVEFKPLLGSNSYSEQVLGPYKIYQPIDPSAFIAFQNENGTVSLTWYDNTNMELGYRIYRLGPDGHKEFTVDNTKDHVGKLVFNDLTIDKKMYARFNYTLTLDFDENQPKFNASKFNSSVEVQKTNPPIDSTKVTDQILFSDVVLNLGAPKPKVTEIVNITPNDYIVNQELISKYISGAEPIPQNPVIGVKLDMHSVSIQPGESIAMIATVQPAEAKNRNLIWSSDSPEVASINEIGQLTGHKQGTAKITVKTEDGGYSDNSIVTVAPLVDAEQQIPIKLTLADMDGHPAIGEIADAVMLGIVNGYPDNTFRPNANVTRVEFAAMLMRGLKTEGDGAALTFQDKASIGDWAVAPVAQAVKLGIINGYSDNTFRPSANITHAEMITMVMRASGLDTSKAPQQTGFSDDAEIPGWAKPSVSKAQETGIIIVGGIDAAFKPQELANRAEAASAIVKMLNHSN